MENRKQLILEFVEDNLNNKSLNGEMIATYLGLSRMQLHRTIKQFSGLNTGELIRQARMEKSIALLQNTNVPIAEIAMAVGFSDTSYFSKVFKASYGCTPSYYRYQMSLK